MLLGSAVKKPTKPGKRLPTRSWRPTPASRPSCAPGPRRYRSLRRNGQISVYQSEVNILVRDYNALSLEERARAIEEARRLGWECAQAYASAHDDDPGSLVVEPRDYIPYVVETAYAMGQC